MKRILSIALFTLLVAGSVLLQLQWVRLNQEAARHIAIADDESAPIGIRLAHARASADIRPDVVRYRQTLASLEASQLAGAGELGAARSVLIGALSLSTPQQLRLRAQLAEVNTRIFLRDARKAHVLHAREKPGGVLLPEDLIP